uniref:Uncharacterized protein n=1 Tax=Arundo donax TaxID=35708 RepID=A0A0A9EP98_ARUDO
MLFVLQGRE